jgi:hypothetical protein
MDEHIGRFDVTMNDQIGVCVRDGAYNIQEKYDAGVHVEAVIIAPGVDRLTFNVLKNDVWLLGCAYPCINQFRDVRM